MDLKGLTQEDLETLLKMIEWWKSRSDLLETDTRVKFHRNNPKVASVRMSSLMYRDACKLAENNPEIGNFNRLVELLLWEKLGRSDEYLAGDAKDNRPDD